MVCVNSITLLLKGLELFNGRTWIWLQTCRSWLWTLWQKLRLTKSWFGHTSVMFRWLHGCLMGKVFHPFASHPSHTVTAADCPPPAVVQSEHKGVKDPEAEPDLSVSLSTAALSCRTQTDLWLDLYLAVGKDLRTSRLTRLTAAQLEQWPCPWSCQVTAFKDASQVLRQTAAEWLLTPYLYFREVEWTCSERWQSVMSVDWTRLIPAEPEMRQLAGGCRRVARQTSDVWRGWQMVRGW